MDAAFFASIGHPRPLRGPLVVDKSVAVKSLRSDRQVESLRNLRECVRIVEF